MLTTTIFRDWSLRNPLWIASADFSHKGKAWHKFLEVEPDDRPGAITLKTTAPNKKTSLKITKKVTVDIHSVRSPLTPKPRGQSSSSIYCDGPPEQEYLSIQETKELLAQARADFDDAAVGISVMMGEDYSSIAASLSDYDFVELNLKYAARPNNDGRPFSFEEHQRHSLDDILANIAAFAGAFSGSTLFVKVTRELPWLRYSCHEMKRLFDLLKDIRARDRVGVIVANTRKARVPNDLIVDQNIRLTSDGLSGGIIAGDVLYIDTFDLIWSMRMNFDFAI